MPMHRAGDGPQLERSRRPQSPEAHLMATRFFVGVQTTSPDAGWPSDLGDAASARSWGVQAGWAAAATSTTDAGEPDESGTAASTGSQPATPWESSGSTDMAGSCWSRSPGAPALAMCVSHTQTTRKLPSFAERPRRMTRPQLPVSGGDGPPPLAARLTSAGPDHRDCNE